ncbi:MAG: energy transducer TonB [Calditrichaeota bacterium]|nr:energy transducer TonB [Calditrichota bacterium]
MRKLLLIGLGFVFILSGCYLGGNVPPKLDKNSLVVIYPPEARAKRIEGKVGLTILIGKDGKVKEAQLAKTSGYPILDQAALQIARLARFKPAKIKGKPHEAWVGWTLIFQIKRQQVDPPKWKAQVLTLEKRIRHARGLKRDQLVQELFYRYKDFAEYLIDHPDRNYNKYILDVVARPIRKRWVLFKNTYSAPFILFDDFVARFPKSEYTPEARLYLEQYIEFAIKDLQSKNSGLSRGLHEKMIQQLTGYLQKIKQEISANPPKDSSLMVEDAGSRPVGVISRAN